MIISVYLDDILIKDTPKLDDLEEIVELDDKLKTWVQKFDDIDLIFFGDGYKYIKAKKDEFGYNNTISVLINIQGGGGGDVINGRIYLTDVKINHTTKKITAPLTDLYWEGSIKQNIKVESYLRSIFTSINGVDISAYAPATVGLRLFDPADGTHDANSRYGVNLVDAIEFMLKYITDDQVDFVDNYFSVEWPTTKFCLVTGRELRLYTNENADRPKTSFEELIINAYKIFGVWYYIDYRTKKPKFVLDTYDNIFNLVTEKVTINNVRDMVEEFDQTSFFTDIEIGTEKYLPPQTVADTFYLPFINGFTHHLEKFHGKNNTTINNPLDLVSNWVMDHNIIAKIFTIPTITEYDNDLFLVECENTGILIDEAIPFTYALLEADIERRYNEDLLNSNRLARFTLPVEIGFDTGTIDDNFRASISVDTSTVTVTPLTPIPFDVEISDPSAQYNPVTYRYTAPTLGNYGFAVDLKMVINGLVAPAYRRFQIWIYQRYASGTLKTYKSKTFDFTTNTGAEGEQMLFAFNMIMAVGDTMEAQLIIQNAGNAGSSYTILKDVSFFYTTYTQNQGGLVTSTANVREFFGSNITFDRTIDLAKWKQIKNFPITDVQVSKADGRIAIGKIKSFRRNLKTGKTSCELVTKGDKIGL